MKEKYESLSLTVLRELAKARNMKHISALRKAELIEAMLKQDELDALAAKEKAGPAVSKDTDKKETENEAAPGTLAEREGEDPSVSAEGSKKDQAVKSRNDSPGSPARSDADEARKDAGASGEDGQRRKMRQDVSSGRRNERRMSTQRGRTDRRTGDSREERRTPDRGGAREDRRMSDQREERRSADRTEGREERRESYRGDQREERRAGERAESREERRISDQREERRAGERAEGREERRESYRGDQREDRRAGERTEGREERRESFRSEQRDERTADRVAESRDDRRQERSEGPEERSYDRPQERYGDRVQDSRDERASSRPPMDLASLDSGIHVSGVLEVMPDGFGFLRSGHYVSGENDVYVAPSQIRKFQLRTGDIVAGNTRIRAQQEKFSALLYVSAINGMPPAQGMRRAVFEDMTPIFPNERLRMERDSRNIAMRIVDLISPIGKGQRGMIVSQPKAGKTTLLKDIATSILKNDPKMNIMIMLIDERPEEVTDIREAIVGERVEVLYSTFDEQPEHHIKVAEMGIERAKRLVEYGEDVTILLDSITRLARASNLTVVPSGRTLSGGLDPSALNMPKRFFGAARNMREGGSLTILATALVETGSKMDDVVFEEFKGTGNMELVLDRKLSERRVFPAIDIQKSSTRREDLLLDPDEMEAVYIMRRALNGMKSEEAVENILNLFVHTRDNQELINRIRRQRMI